MTVAAAAGQPPAGACLAIVTAAGSGSRLGAGRPKALVEVGGQSLVGHAVVRMIAAGCVDRIIVTHPVAEREQFAAAITASVGTHPAVPVELIPGGSTRQASVANALAGVGVEFDVVLVHDAARAMAPAALVRRVHDAVRAGHGAVVPGVPVSDTVKQVASPTGAGAKVVATVDRTRLRAIQTPQGFHRELLRRAHAAAADRGNDEGLAATDDAGLVEALGAEVWLVTGEEEARKITVPADLLWAEALLSRP